jgi:hypothetical protein
MARRNLIALLGGFAILPALAPFLARADKLRRIGVLMNLRPDDPEGQKRLVAFTQALEKYRWSEGSNIHTEVRFSGADANLYHRNAEELVALGPDVLLASGNLSVAALQGVTRVRAAVVMGLPSPDRNAAIGITPHLTEPLHHCDASISQGVGKAPWRVRRDQNGLRSAPAYPGPTASSRHPERSAISSQRKAIDTGAPYGRTAR